MIAVPRPSATVCVLRRRDGRTEVLMAQRGAGARFMGGAWVFPGGTVDDADRSDDTGWLPDVDPEHRPWVSAALRELAEEAGLWLTDPPELLPAATRNDTKISSPGRSVPTLAGEMLLFSNWITPTVVPVRFDTRFYVVEVPGDTEAEADGVEMDAVAWIEPAEAVRRSASDDMLVPFPTVRTLKHFTELGDAGAILDHARSRVGDVPPTQPRIRVGADGAVEALLPGDDAYDDTPDLPPDPSLLSGVASVRAATGERIPELERRP